jgi:hypothetical protein
MGTEKQEKHMVSITFLFTSEGHEAIWGTLSTVVFFERLVLRLLPQFLGVFSQGQIPTHTGMVPLLAPRVRHLDRTKVSQH